jgi:tetratricopeptide (TPR) repeat protein
MLATLREAESLAESLDDPRRLAQVCGFLSNYFRLMGAYDQAIATAQRTLALAIADGEVVLAAQANYYLGMAYQAQGDYRRAIGLPQAVDGGLRGGTTPRALRSCL